MKIKLLLCSMLLSTIAMAQQQRTETELSGDWQFSHDHQSWQQVSVPHDWAISGPFDKKWDLQTVAIVQNGEQQATEKSGRSGALPWIGEGYYKRKITIPSGFNGHAELLFDGAMSQPVISINGQKAGSWAYGYNSFRIDITQFIQTGDNLLEVSLKNLEESSRWYPGAGLYRPVKLILTNNTHIDDWGVAVRTIEVHQKKNDIATVKVDVPIIGYEKGTTVGLSLFDAEGKQISNSNNPAPMRSEVASAAFYIPHAKLWSPESPYLYRLNARVYKNGQCIDEKNINVGIRTVQVSKEKGFQLNGVTRKLKGVCLHHDLGPLGAAINKAALIRQIKILKEMGCDAIRTAHNMPSQMQMDVCDSLGMMVMAESFDMWIYPKCKNGYARFFHEWADKDITNLVLAHRNHPSIIMWSIGNEIPEQGSIEGRQIAIRLQGLCHSLDPTRPVTQGMDRIDNAMATGFAQAMEVPGMNYRLHRYQAAYNRLQHGFLLGSETASTVSSRGVYKFPVTPTDHGVYPDGQCSGYDVEWCSWSNLPDDDWRWQDDNDWVIGEFVWTGFDYLGEPTPYDEYWPSRSSYFGICDLAGLPKDRYYLYRSHWQKEQHTIHLLPHWSWGKSKKDKDNRLGEITPVYCYTDYPEAELFVNGKSQGRIKKVKENGPTALDEHAFAKNHRLDRYRLRWNDVRYEPGELKVVVFDETGEKRGEKTLRTAGKPARLQLNAWTQNEDGTLTGDGNDLAFITVSLTDKQGTLVPDATDQLSFEVQGAGTFKAVCNGDATSLESFTQPTMKLFGGQLVVVVQTQKHAGTLTLKVTDKQRGLKATLPIKVI